LIEHVKGRIELDEAVERIKIATRQLARRQMKWFRRFNPVHWLDGREGIESLAERALQMWNGRT
jgi:tRNA dimethylallyltransferase